MLTLVFFAVGFCSTVAAADTREEANALYKAGNKMYQKGDFKGALAMYWRAQSLFPSYKIAYNIGQTLAELKRYSKAAAYFEYFLSRAGKVAPESYREAAKKRLLELQAKLFRLKLRCSEGGAAVKIDGQKARHTPLARSIYLAPGEHRIVVDKQGYHPWSRDIRARPGEYQQLAIRLEPRTLGALDAERRKPPTAPEAQQDTSRRPGGQRFRSRAVWGYATVGVAAALGLTAAVLYGVGGSRGSEAHDAYLAATSAPGIATEAQITRHQDDIDGARSQIIAANVLLGAAAVAAGVSVYLFLTRPEAPSRQHSTVFNITPTGDGAAVYLGGRF